MDLIVNILPPVVHQKMDALTNPPFRLQDREVISNHIKNFLDRLPYLEKREELKKLKLKFHPLLTTAVMYIYKSVGLPDELKSREDVAALCRVNFLVALLLGGAAYVAIKTILYLLIGKVLWFVGGMLINILGLVLKIFDSLTVVAPGYIALYVLKAGEEAGEVESKGSEVPLIWIHHILSLPSPSKSVPASSRKTLGALVLTYFTLSPLINLVAVFLPFSLVLKPLLATLVYHPMYSLVPWLFKNLVHEKPWFVTACLLLNMDCEQMPANFENLIAMRSIGVVAPVIRFNAGLKTSVSEEWSEVNKTDAVECRIVKLKVREIDVGDNENDDVTVVVKQAPNNGRKVNPKIETLVFKTPTLKVGKTDTSALEIPIVPARNVTLVLEIRGKMTFGSDPVLSTHKLNIETMFVGNTMMKKASDVEIRDDSGCRVVVDVECDDTTKYM
jgi:hypothetical protein